jgi:hypothetical protein
MEPQRYTATEKDAQLLGALKKQLTPSQSQATNILVDKAQLGRDMYQTLTVVPKDLLRFVLANFSDQELNDIILNIMCMFELKKMTRHIIQNYQKWESAPKFSANMFSSLEHLAKKDDEEISESDYRELVKELMAFKVKYDLTKISQVEKIYVALLKDLVQKSGKRT